jgi:uncharacterized protein YajQ (UPF0234 family)
MEHLMQPDSTTSTPRRCRITLKDLAESFDMVSSEITAFLDLDGGEVLFIIFETARELEQVYEAMPAALANASDEEQREAILAVIAEEEIDISDEESILEADAIDRGLGTRYIALPEADSREGYRDMEAFIDTVSDARLQSRLDRAIRGRGAFRRFKDELRDAEADVEQRWYAFKQQRLEERARTWLADEGIELVTE